VPFVITEFITPVLVRPMDPEGKANARAHVSQLKPASVRCEVACVGECFSKVYFDVCLCILYVTYVVNFVGGCFSRFDFLNFSVYVHL
jgi:hypothetical protein